MQEEDEEGQIRMLYLFGGLRVRGGGGGGVVVGGSLITLTLSLSRLVTRCFVHVDVDVDAE